VVCIDPALALNSQRLAGELVDDVQQLEVVAISGLIPLEVQRPHMIRRLGPQPVSRHRGLCPRSRFSPQG
jgi:hypothetical protein